MDDEQKMRIPTGIRFSPVIELGHILQAVTIIGFVGGWALVGYYKIDQSLADHSRRMDLSDQRQVTDEQSVRDLRATDEQSIKELRASLQGSSQETRQRLDKLIDQIADLRGAVSHDGIHR